MLRVFESFSGYGSQSIALHELAEEFSSFAYKIVGISEIDSNALTAYYSLPFHKGVKNYGDIEKINWHEVPDFDLLTYSFPCQDISLAGKQQGLEEGSGTRSSLLWECKKAIEIKKPKYLLMENVKALSSKKFRPYLDSWARYLNEQNYTNYTKVLNAADFGIPQHRERVFMVSVRGEFKFNFPEPIPLKKRLKDILEPNVDESYYLSEKLLKGFLAHNENHLKKKTGFLFKPKFSEDIASCIRANASLCPTDNSIKEVVREPKIIKVGNYCPSGHNSCNVYGIDGINPTVMLHHGSVTAIMTPCNTMIRRIPESYPMIVYSEYVNGKILTFYFRIRKLTERECFRLMGLREEYINCIKSAGICKTHQYKLAGNSICISVLKSIFRNMFIKKENNSNQLQIL